MQPRAQVSTYCQLTVHGFSIPCLPGRPGAIAVVNKLAADGRESKCVSVHICCTACACVHERYELAADGRESKCVSVPTCTSHVHICCTTWVHACMCPRAHLMCIIMCCTIPCSQRYTCACALCTDAYAIHYTDHQVHRAHRHPAKLADLCDQEYCSDHDHHTGRPPRPLARAQGPLIGVCACVYVHMWTHMCVWVWGGGHGGMLMGMGLCVWVYSCACPAHAHGYMGLCVWVCSHHVHAHAHIHAHGYGSMRMGVFMCMSMPMPMLMGMGLCVWMCSCSCPCPCPCSCTHAHRSRRASQPRSLPWC